MEVESKRLRDLFAEICAQTLTADAAHDFTHEVAEGERMVAVLAARLPPRLLCGEDRCHALPVVCRPGRQHRANRGEARARSEERRVGKGGRGRGARGE